ncbi:hypothetical protein, partial [Inquilinus sp.]|uniref:hypothetical protein n=1 Tax=Inquilinus sp. TaxID=1932117 RepID=UPI0031D76BA8
YHRSIAAEDVGGPEGETWVIDTINGEIFDQDWTLIRTLPKDDRPPDSGAAGPPAATAPPDPGGNPPGTAPSGEDQDEAERKRLRRERDAEGRRAMMMAHIFRHA